MTTTSIPLDYALTPVRKPVMPRGAVALVSFLLAGLPSLLLCGRRRIRLLLGLNGLILAAAAILAFAWPLILSDEDYAGWLWGFIAFLVDLVGMCIGLRDRRELILTGTPQATPHWVWMALFWFAAVLAGAAVCGATFSIFMFAVFGSVDVAVIGASAVVLIAAVFLVTVILNTLSCLVKGTR
jgi:hypothetical protein